MMDQIGRYRILGELGRGAMGVVYHATDPAIGRSVAIKTIRIRDINDTQERDRLRERLFREARSAGVLSHPNIVTIYDMDEVDGLAYIAMAYVNGPTLEKVLSSEEPLSGARMLRILRQAASALDYAHARGIVHRDVKPANIMTDEDGSVKITDFGIAKITAGMHSTDTTTVAGTPNYMSPEQVQGLGVDGRSDQFSLAVIAYEILTGERPFVGEHLSTIVYKIVAEEPAPANRINGTLTSRIDEVLRKGLSKKPADRFPNCSNFVGALELACAESRGWKTLPAGGAAAMPTVAVNEPPFAIARAEAEAEAWQGSEESSGPPRRSLLLPALMSVAVVIGVAAIVLYQLGGLPGQTNAPQEHAQAKAPETRVQPPPAAPVEQAPAEQPDTKAAPDATVETPKPEASGTVATPPSPQSQPAAPQPAARKEDAPPAKTIPDKTVPDEPQPTEPRQRIKVPQSRLQDIWVATNPPGAKAVLDDNLAQACRTPCFLHGSPGVHHLTISQAGYQNEYREIHVGDTAYDVAPISLRQPEGTLWLTTSPPGATVLINGKPIAQRTPAQITLPPGSYTVTVEKNGQSRTERIQLHDGLVSLKLPLDQ
jgi:serine/threonine-protein kinase